MPDNTLIKVEGVYKSYTSAREQIPILKNVNFKVKMGEFVSIVGPSGSGKSSLLNILGTLDRPTLEKCT